MHLIKNSTSGRPIVTTGQNNKLNQQSDFVMFELDLRNFSAYLSKSSIFDLCKFIEKISTHKVFTGVGIFGLLELTSNVKNWFSDASKDGCCV